MVSSILVKIVWLLAVVELCYSSSIIPESIEKRLCRAQFVFKFQVISTSRKVCFRPNSRTFAPTNTNANATPTTATTKGTTTKGTTTAATTRKSTTTTTPTRTANLTTVKTSNQRHVSTVSTKQPASNTTLPSQKPRQKRCIALLHQNIIIYHDRVFRGKDKLAKINAVKELNVTDHPIYFSYVRLDLNFQSELPNGDYVYIGRQIGKIEYQVFLKNPATVIPWSKNLEQKLNNFDFVKDCQK